MIALRGLRSFLTFQNALSYILGPPQAPPPAVGAAKGCCPKLDIDSKVDDYWDLINARYEKKYKNSGELAESENSTLLEIGAKVKGMVGTTSRYIGNTEFDRIETSEYELHDKTHMQDNHNIGCRSVHDCF